MKKVNSFFLSQILHNNVYDEYGDIGKLSDIYVTNEELYPKAIGYIIKKGGEYFNYEFRNIDIYKNEENGKLKVSVKGVKDIIPRKYSYLLSKNLLDKPIVDINGKKLVKVNDLRIAELSGELKVVAVDTSRLAFARRYKIDGVYKFICSILNKKAEESLIIWDNVESIDLGEDLKLSVSYKKLSKLHPADIADILEDMDSEYRHKVFESLEENLAADTLEEIEPQYQADILESLSISKTAEVLENMPNDEIADLLDEVDEKTKEKILINLEKEDADEVEALLRYKDEEAGSLMNKDYISFDINITCEETIELLRQLKPEDEVAYYIYITDDDKLKGVVSLKDIILADKDKYLKDIMLSDIIKVRDNDSLEKAVDLAIKYNLLSLPLVDKEDKLTGIIVLSDIIDEVLLPVWKRKFRH